MDSIEILTGLCGGFFVGSTVAACGAVHYYQKAKSLAEAAYTSKRDAHAASLNALRANREIMGYFDDEGIVDRIDSQYETASRLMAISGGMMVRQSEMGDQLQSAYEALIRSTPVPVEPVTVSTPLSEAGKRGAAQLNKTPAKKAAPRKASAGRVRKTGMTSNDSDAIPGPPAAPRNPKDKPVG